jgi:solute:Na+ symporter, SSS family
MHTIDYAIILLYLVLIVIAGYIIQRRASKNIDTYFLGNRNLPWWVLGASGMAANVDISGTMINTALIYAIGSYAMYIEFRGGVVLILAFLMVMMGKWNRRSGAMTLAEWMHLRFGKGIQGDFARLISAVASLILTVALISYFAIASGKFAAEFLGIDWRLAAALMVGIAASYCVASGLYAVVWVDLLQGFIILGVTLYICVTAFVTADVGDVVQTSVPLADGGYEIITNTYKNWTSIIPPARLNLPGDYSIYNLFGVAIAFYFLKAVLEGFGGGNSYMAQRFFACKNDKEAGLTSLFWIFLLMFRWPLTASLALLGVYYGMNHGVITDPEQVLPIVVNAYMPIGIKGLVVAGFIAAAMSTVDATVNAGASYWVKDIYQGYINPKASERKLMVHSKLSTIIILAIGLLFSFTVRNVNEIWGWTMMGIASGVLIPQLLRWYWWRFNGYGFAIGTFAGTITAIMVKILFGQIPEYYLFIVSSGASLMGCILGTYLTPVTDMAVLENFYKNTRPFGLWGRVSKSLTPTTMAGIKTEHRRDIISVIIAVPWQVCLFLSGMMLIFKRWDTFFILLATLLVLSVLLYYNWYRHLHKEVSVE